MCLAFENLTLPERLELGYQSMNRCPYKDFAVWLETQRNPRVAFPVLDESQFYVLLKEFLARMGGRFSSDFGFDSNGNILYARAVLYSNVNDQASATVAHSAYERWETFVADRNKDFSTPYHAWQSSQLWARAETEYAAVNGAIAAWMISNICAFVAILLFTGNIIIATGTTASIICIVGCLFGIMLVALGWKFGAVEAISVGTPQILVLPFHYTE